MARDSFLLTFVKIIFYLNTLRMSWVIDMHNEAYSFLYTKSFIGVRFNRNCNMSKQLQKKVIVLPLTSSRTVT